MCACACVHVRVRVLVCSCARVSVRARVLVRVLVLVSVYLLVHILACADALHARRLASELRAWGRLVCGAALGQNSKQTEHYRLSETWYVY